MEGRGGKDVSIANRRGTRDTGPLTRTRGVREVEHERATATGVAGKKSQAMDMENYG